MSDQECVFCRFGSVHLFLLLVWRNPVLSAALGKWRSRHLFCAGVKKYRVLKIERPSTHGTLLNGTVCISAFCQGHASLRACLWKEDSLSRGTANVLAPVTPPQWLLYTIVSSTYLKGTAEASTEGPWYLETLTVWPAPVCRKLELIFHFLYFKTRKNSQNTWPIFSTSVYYEYDKALCWSTNHKRS